MEPPLGFLISYEMVYSVPAVNPEISYPATHPLPPLLVQANVPEVGWVTLPATIVQSLRDA